jgi:hypothetical protein
LFATTFPFLLAQYRKVFIYTDAIRGNNRTDSTQLFLESAAGYLTRYLDVAGNNLLITTLLPDGTNPTTGAIAATSPIFNILPADSVNPRASTTRLNRGQVVPASRNGYPNLLSLPRNTPGGFSIDGVDSFKPSLGADTLYVAPLVYTTGVPFNLYRTVAARRFRSVGDSKPNLIFFNMELHRLSGDAAAFNQFFDKVLNQDFNP